MARKDKPLTAKSSIGDWLNHPVGGEIFRAMLAEAGQDEKVLAPVRLFSLQRVASMSKGMMSQELIDAATAEESRPDLLLDLGLPDARPRGIRDAG